MAALTHTLQIDDGAGGTFSFLVPPSFEPRLEATFKEASTLQEVEQIRTVWEFTNARLVSSDGTADTFWDEFNAFRALIETRAATYPAFARVVRDPAGAAEVVWTLSSAAYEDFRIEIVQGRIDPDLPAASWNVLANLQLTISAVKRNADANGIVSFSQIVDTTTDDGGNKQTTWLTQIGTLEGVSAIAVAKAFAAIDISSFGQTYTFLTNNSDGVDIRELDPDVINGRVVTRVEATSVVKQWGIQVGTTGPGLTPSRVSFRVATSTSKDETIVTTVATARGPGAFVWVKSKRPSVFDDEELSNETAGRDASGVWKRRTQSTRDPDVDDVRWEIRAQITGGHQSFDFEPVPGGFEPVEFSGGIMPFRVDVTVRVTRLGGSGLRSELKLPGLLARPWRFDFDSSREDESGFELERGVDDESTKWARDVSLVYFAARPPSRSVIAEIRAATPVESYFL